jgi:dTDP-4-dehydrorhamnose reductase
MHSPNNKILVTGGSGMVGSQVAFGTKPDRKELDIIDSLSIKRTLDHYQPTVVLHLAALTDMGECEKNPEYAYETNVVGTYNIAKVCREKNIRLIYFSTCAVFDGNKNAPYSETDSVHPLNAYGRTKWLGELVVKNIVPDSLIIRTGWLFGGGKTDKKFAKLCFEKLRRGEEVNAVSDRWGSPTYIPDLLKTIEDLIKNKTNGIVHVVNDGKATYFEIAKVVKEFGSFAPEIKPVKAEEIESPEVKRGKMEALTSQKVKLRNWREALKEYIETLC